MCKSIKQLKKLADIYLGRRWIAKSIGSHIGISFSGVFTRTLYASLCTALQIDICTV